MTDPVLFHPAVLRSDVFSGLTHAQFQAVVPMLRRRHLRKNEFLFREGDWGDSMAVLTDGTLNVRVSEGRRIVPILDVQPGEVVGEMACIDPAPRSATVSALENTMALILDRTSLDALRAAAPDVAIAIVSAVLKRVVARLRQTNERLVRELGMEGQGTDAGAEIVEDTPAPVLFEGGLRLQDLPPEAGFSAEDFPNLLALTEPLYYEAGEVIAKEGSPHHCCHLLVRGSVEVSCRMGLKDHHLATLGPGAMLGQLALVDHRPRSATVRALEPVVTLEMDRAHYERLLTTASPFALRFQERIAVAAIRQLRLANQKLTPLLERCGVATRFSTDPAAVPIGRVAITRASVALTEWTLEIEDED